MTINISASSFEVTDAIRDYIERRLLPLSCCNPRILCANVMLDWDEHRTGRKYLIRTQLDIGGRKASQTCHSAHLHEGIDFAARELIAHLCKPRAKAEVER